MSATTLVLNARGLPINVVDFRRAHCYIANKKAEVLVEYEDKYFGTWDKAMNAPAIVKLLYFLKPAHDIARYLTFCRKNVYERDKGVCAYCGQKLSLSSMTFDHVIPRDQGGKTRWNNIVTCCQKCNTKKANRTPEEAGMILKIQPRAPRIKISDQRESRLRNLKNIPHESWKSYIYWNVTLEAD